MFNFSFVSVKEVQKLLKDVDSKNATGYDNIPPKILKIAANELVPLLANLVNLSVTKPNFPMDLKKSELSPLYKCKDSLVKIIVVWAYLHLSQKFSWKYLTNS